MWSPSLHLCAAPPSLINTLNHDALRRTTTAIKQRHRLSPRIQCCAATGGKAQPPVRRRSGNYHPNLWVDDHIQSLVSSNHTVEEEEESVVRINRLKENVRKLIKVDGKEQEKDVEGQLQLIDHLQQLGVAYHFKDELRHALGSIHASLEDVTFRLKDDLRAAALLFRLLRENGFSVSDRCILKQFVDDSGKLKAELIRRQSVLGILSLYEASFHGKEGEFLLEEAMDLTTKHLQCLLMETEGSTLGATDSYYLKQHVAHALELPLNWRMQRLQTKWFIHMCQRKPTVDPLLLELAELDFNMFQKIHRRELAELSRWWKYLDLPRKLPFFRDRLAENYLWAVGFTYEPEHWAYRQIITKVVCFIIMIDDNYDVHGTLDELQLFTEAIDRWDVNAIDTIPEYMKICFLALFNTMNDAGYAVIKERGLNTITYLRRAWADLCESFLKEAKWYNRKYVPNLDEYLDNGRISSSVLVILSHAYCVNDELTKEALESFSSSYPPVSRPSSMLLRLYNDLATASAENRRGDVPESIHCCMQEMNVSEAVARRHIKELIKKNWRELNGERTATFSSEEKFKNIAINIPRMAQFLYQHEDDGYGVAHGETKRQVFSLLIDPIKLKISKDNNQSMKWK